MPGGNTAPWNNQVEDWVKVWTDTQKKMWENWSGLAATAPAPASDSDWADYWRKWAGQGLSAAPVGGEATATEVAERLLASQKAWAQFLQFLTGAWQGVAAKVDSGQDWHQTLTSYSEQLRQQLTQPLEKTAALGQDLVELWRLYLEEFNKITQPWLRSSELARGHVGQAITGDNSAALINLANLYWDAYERTFGRLLESPSMGYSRELNEKVLKGFDIWQDFRQASFEYQVVLADTWVKAFERVMEELVARAKNDQPIKSLRDLALLWNDIADPVFIEVFRTEKFIRVQGRLLNAAMTYRLHQRELTELYLKANDLPTRSEVDEAHRKIYEQGKAIKALKKALTAVSAAPASEAPAPEPSTPGPPAQEAASVGYAPAADLEEARRSIEALRQEVTALQEALATQNRNGGNGSHEAGEAKRRKPRRTATIPKPPSTASSTAATVAARAPKAARRRL